MCKLKLKSPLVRRVLGLGGVGSGWRQKFTSMCSSPEVLTASATNYCIHTSGSRSNAWVTCSAHAHACNGNTPSVTPMQIFAPNSSPALTSCRQGCRHRLLSVTAIPTLTLSQYRCHSHLTYVRSDCRPRPHDFRNTSRFVPKPVHLDGIFFCMLRHTLTYSLPPSFLQT
jgi:hypothetical protein